MTVASEISRSGPYNGNGVTTVFDYDFKIVHRDHLKVIKADAAGDEITLTIDVDYDVSGVGDVDGSVSFSVPPATGETITILRNVPLVQETDLENQGAYFAETVEAAFDLAAMRDQQLQEQLTRAVLVPASSDDGGGTLASDLASGILRLADSADEIDNVASIKTDVTAVAGIAADVALLADNAAILSGTASAIYASEDLFVGDGIDTTWVLSTSPPSEANVDVWIGGAIQTNADFSIAGNVLTITPAVANGVQIIAKTRVYVSANDVYDARDQVVAVAAGINVGAFATAAQGVKADAAVQFVTQTLTAPQQVQARSNIGAASSAEVAAILPVMKSGSSATAVAFNTLSVSGQYCYLASANAPTTLYAGEWNVSVSASAATGNVYQTVAPAISPWAQWSRNKIGSTWSAWTPVGGFITPEHYGATGVFNSGVGNANHLEAAFRSGFAVRLVGAYNLERLVTCGSGYGDTNVSVEGTGQEHIRATATGAGIAFYPGAANNFTAAARCLFRDFIMICTVTGHTSSAIAVNGNATGGTGATVKNFEFHNVHTFGESSTKGFLYGITVDNGRNGTIRGCQHQGVLTNGQGSRAGAGFWIYGNDDPVDITIDDCKAYYCQTSFNITGTAEGVKVTNCTGVGVDRGLFAELNENPISGRNTGKQLLMIDKCHFNAFFHGIKINRVWDIMIQNVSILFEAANSNAQGIELTMEGDLQLRAHIDCVSIQDRTPAAPGTGLTIGINVGNTNTTLGTMVRITNTLFDSVDFGIYAQPSTNDIKYDANSCIFTNTGSVTGGNTAGITGY